MDGVRNSVVQEISINDVVFGSNVRIGDTTHIKAYSRAFAVHILWNKINGLNRHFTYLQYHMREE